MPFSTFIELKDNYEIQVYKKAKNMDKREHIPFSGSPQKHPYEHDKIILIADPFTRDTFYYEFRARDIGFAEELPSLTTIDGESVIMVRIWVKKQSVGIRCTPFIVDSLSHR